MFLWSRGDFYIGCTRTHTAWIADSPPQLSQNWAKRSVCSRCFPGIEPDYKVVVFNYVQPVLQIVAQQEQHAEIQRGTEWLAGEERRLRREQQQANYQGPEVGRKYIADHGKQGGGRSPLPSPGFGGGYDGSTLQHMQMAEMHRQEAESVSRGGYRSSGRDLSLSSSTRSLGANDYAPGSVNSTSRAYMQNEGAYYGAVAGPPEDFTHEVGLHPGRIDTKGNDSPPGESRFHLINSPESVSSFRFAPFSPQMTELAFGPESPTATIANRRQMSRSRETTLTGISFRSSASDKTAGNSEPHSSRTGLSHSSSGEQVQSRVPLGERHTPQPRLSADMDPIGQGRPATNPSTPVKEKGDKPRLAGFAIGLADALGGFDKEE